MKSPMAYHKRLEKYYQIFKSLYFDVEYNTANIHSSVGFMPFSYFEHMDIINAMTNWKHPTDYFINNFKAGYEIFINSVNLDDSYFKAFILRFYDDWRSEIKNKSLEEVHELLNTHRL